MVYKLCTLKTRPCSRKCLNMKMKEKAGKHNTACNLATCKSVSTDGTGQPTLTQVTWPKPLAFPSSCSARLDSFPRSL